MSKFASLFGRKTAAPKFDPAEMNELFDLANADNTADDLDGVPQDPASDDWQDDNDPALASARNLPEWGDTPTYDPSKDLDQLHPNRASALRAAAAIDEVLAEVPYDDEPPVGNDTPEEGDNPFAPETLENDTAASVKTAADASDPRGTLSKLSSVKLKQIANDAVKAFGIDPSWTAPHTNDKDELIQHIDEMCNEFNLRVQQNGSLRKATAAAKTAEMNLVDPEKSYSKEPGDVTDTVADQGFQAAHPRSLTPHALNSKEAAKASEEDPILPSSDTAPLEDEPFEVTTAAPKFDPAEMNELFNLASDEFDSEEDELVAEGDESPFDTAASDHTAFNPAQLKNQVVVLTGAPPKPFQKKHIADLLMSDFGVKDVKPIFSRQTTCVVYDETRPSETSKLKKAKAAGLLLVPYGAVLEARTATAEEHEAAPPKVRKREEDVQIQQAVQRAVKGDTRALQQAFLVAGKHVDYKQYVPALKGLEKALAALGPILRR